MRKRPGKGSPDGGVGKTSGGGESLSAESLLSAGPTHTGNAFKLHSPMFYQFCPPFLQRWIETWWCLQMFRPQWKSRFLVLIGAFLYKFRNEHGREPKGSPIPTDTVDVYVVASEDRADESIPSLPDGYRGLFCVSSLRKQQFYAVATNEEASIWVTSLRERRQETVRQSMGHQGSMPYPFERFDSMARALVQRKERIKARVEAMRDRDLDAAAYGGGGGAGRGHFA